MRKIYEYKDIKLTATGESDDLLGSTYILCVKVDGEYHELTHHVYFKSEAHVLMFLSDYTD